MQKIQHPTVITHRKKKSREEIIKKLRLKKWNLHTQLVGM